MEIQRRWSVLVLRSEDQPWTRVTTCRRVEDGAIMQCFLADARAEAARR